MEVLVNKIAGDRDIIVTRDGGVASAGNTNPHAPPCLSWQTNVIRSMQSSLGGATVITRNSR